MANIGGAPTSHRPSPTRPAWCPRVGRRKRAADLAPQKAPVMPNDTAAMYLPTGCVLNAGSVLSNALVPAPVRYPATTALDCICSSHRLSASLSSRVSSCRSLRMATRSSRKTLGTSARDGSAAGRPRGRAREVPRTTRHQRRLDAAGGSASRAVETLEVRAPPTRWRPRTPSRRPRPWYPGWTRAPNPRGVGCERAPSGEFAAGEKWRKKSGTVEKVSGRGMQKQLASSRGGETAAS